MLLFLMKVMYSDSFFELPRLVKFFRLRKYQKRRPQFRPYEVASTATARTVTHANQDKGGLGGQ